MKPRRSHLYYLLLVYALGVACFTCFRWLLLSLHQKDIHYSGMLRHRKVFEAFMVGFRFDTVISCYLLALPFVLMGLLAVSGLLRAWALRLAYAFVSFTFITAFFLCAADIPFFAHFFRRLDDTVLAWSSHGGFGLRMVLQESSYHWFIFVFVAAVSLHTFLLGRIRRAHLRWFRSAPQTLRLRPALRNTMTFVLTAGLFLLGMRGRVAAKTPILAGAAYICDDPTINSLGLNAVFTFMRTMIDARQPDNRRLHWMEDAKALQITASQLGADPRLKTISPLARMEEPGGELAGRNVVLIIMESMSSAKMRRFGNTEALTPFLDSLANVAWSFDNIWSAGIHTYNGIYSTLSGHPALMKKHPMEQVDVPRIDGLPVMLRNAGYQTMFFTTHDELFDNMSGFLSANGVDRIIGQKDYPEKEVKSAMGVPDEYMFRYAMPVLNNAVADCRKPFFAAFMTGSDHDPIVIPKGVGYVPRHEDKYQQSANYADWSLGRFLSYASRQSWYANTLFVFVADHGCWMGVNHYDVSFSYQHIPLVMFAPGYTSAKTYPGLGLQTDVPATVAGLVLKRPYLNLTLSRNLLDTAPGYAVFSNDNRLACMNDSLLYIYRGAQEAPGLYRYRNFDEHDYYSEDSAGAISMREKAFAWLQSSQYVIGQRTAARR